ncbi:predicted protein [Uncinocarpus reesii 1704]|uniref:Uncharacterized protein n=1 Tax=Uncinocarpus reesii (strain UAMH 1704) TaxID=336963 RepID=C4JN47_UNCRE|nr:uncharacterized protein UREG_04255 [Uncinocarpus reesii 1704]EEP79409.1 predicted protein [Uncinocarpus reesii 1704]
MVKTTTKLPKTNHRFSIERDRTVSRTQSLFDNVVGHFRINKTRHHWVAGYSNKAMPRNTPASLAIEHGSGDDTAHLSRVAQRLCSILSLFGQPGFSNDLDVIEKTYADEIREQKDVSALQRSICTIWQVKQQEISELEEKISEFEKQKSENEKAVKAAKRERVELEKQKKDLERARGEEKSRMEEESRKKLQAKEKELDKASQKKIEKAKADIKAAYDTLKADKEMLEKQSSASEKALKDEIHDLQLIKKSLRAENAELKIRLSAWEPHLGVAKMSPSNYRDRLRELSEDINNFAERYFDAIPENIEIVGSLGKYEKLSEASPIFEYTSLSAAPISKYMRKAAVRQFISTRVVLILESQLLVQEGQTTAAEFLQNISASLDPPVRTVWKTITAKGLDQVPDFSVDTYAQRFAEHTLGLLQSLVKNSRDQVVDDLKKIFAVALNIWKTKRNNSDQIVINNAPDPSDGVWQVDTQQSLLINEQNIEPNKNRPQCKKPKPFALFPQVIGEFESDSGDGKTTREILHPGIALFSDSPVYNLALDDMEELKIQFRGLHQRHPSSPISPQSFIKFSIPNKLGTNGIAS